MGKVCVIGLDGGTFRIIDYLAAQGRLPNMSRLLEHGSRGPLESTNPPLTPAAWASFYTGTNPGKHGVVDFFQRVPGTYRLSPVNAGTVAGPSLWSLAGEQGLRVCVYNVPITYPPRPVNGLLISGMDTPRLDEQAFYPAGLMQELLSQVPEFAINPCVDPKYLVNRHSDPTGEYIRLINAHLAMELKTIRYLMRREDWDLFVAVVRSTDIFQHAFWSSAEKVIDSEGEDISDNDRRRADAVFACYEAIDRELGDNWGDWCSDRNLVMMSDHGFGRLHREVCLNRVLAGAGLLGFRRKSASRRVKETAFRRARTLLPPAARRKILKAAGRDDRAGRAGLLFIDALVADIDWGRTSIYSRGQFGCLFVNSKGREPDGIVEGEEARQRVLDEAQVALAAIIEPEDGQPVVTGFARREELYDGPRLPDMPDMVISMRDNLYRGIYSTFVELADDPLIRPPHPEHGELAQTGNHRSDGILIMQGNDVRHTQLQRARIIDVAPTLLSLLGIPCESDMDGTVLGEAVTAECLERAETAVDSDSATGLGPDQTEAVYSQDDEDEVRKNLEDLGYL